MEPYDHKVIERKWQQAWTDASLHTPDPAAPGEKTFVLDMFPYPSGAGLHVGHLLGYTGTDVLARYYRMQGHSVLHPMGWDAFGLPAENFAIKTGVHPALSTAENIQSFKRQLQQVGYSYDWSREINTADPGYYRWTQWFFQLLYKRGLAYRKEGLVNWCPSCQTVLANEQVVAGKCERCGAVVEQRQLKQWYFKITDYAERLLQDLDALDWPEKIKAMQRNWIGKSEGAYITFQPEKAGSPVQVFTTRPDTLYGVTFLVLAPEHPAVWEFTTAAQHEAMHQYLEATARKNELQRQHLDQEKTGVFTGSCVAHPLTGQPIPVWVADYVLGSYGTGAIMAVPAHDERDYAFAQSFNLPIHTVIEPVTGAPRENEERRRSIVAIVENPRTGQVLTLNWGSGQGGHLFVGGGIEDGEDVVEAAKREILEETGYQHLNLVRQSETIHHHYVAHSKGVNRFIQAVGLYFRLEDDAQTQPTLAADEVDRFTLEWLDTSSAEQKVADELHRLVFQRLVTQTPYSGKGVLTNSGPHSGQTSEEASAAILEQLSERGVGEVATTYRLRDWLVSRQRFWGAPIPVMYDESGNEHLVPEEQLPVTLPMNVDFKPTGQSPLVDASEWRTVVKDGKTYHREVDTLDTFVCSSWYFLRFPNPSVSDRPFDKEAVAAWLPVNVYVGGAEHAVLHLLYARFLTKVLHDAGCVSFDEPFQSLRNQGMILGPDHQKMSKSRGNVISPDDLIQEHGADALRMYELFLAPFDLEKPWNVTGIVGVRRFLDKVWRLQGRVAQTAAQPEELKVVHRAIAKVSADLPELKFNTAIAGLMEAANALSEQSQLSQEAYLLLIRLLSPFAPHLAEEIWHLQGQTGFCAQAAWPQADSTYLIEDTREYPVQINGKVRTVLSFSAHQEDVAELEKAALADPHVEQLLSGKKVQKVIVVPGRLISIVTE